MEESNQAMEEYQQKLAEEKAAKEAALDAEEKKLQDEMKAEKYLKDKWGQGSDSDEPAGKKKKKNKKG